MAIRSSAYETLAGRFRPVFDRIADDALGRESRLELSREQLDWLVDAGFAKLRVPVELGGDDVSLSDVLRLIAELAEADVNLAHIWRNHFAFGEELRYDRADDRTNDWFRRIARGEMIGGGWSEPAGAAPATVTEDENGGLVLTGVKAYSTGSVYASWSSVLARFPDETRAVVLVPIGAPGVQVRNDWDGFGQRLTGSGTVRYDAVTVERRNVFAHTNHYGHREHFYQSVLNALLVGITRSVIRDGSRALTARVRNHERATVADPSRDPQLLQTVGELSAQCFAAESSFEASIAACDEAIERESASALDEAFAHVIQAQAVVSSAALDVSSRMFDVLGASGTSRSLALDRHWRNARTLISHNPRLYRSRALGDWLINETPLL